MPLADRNIAELDQVDPAYPAGWRMGMVFCHVLMASAMLTALVYALVQMRVFDLFNAR